MKFVYELNENGFYRLEKAGKEDEYVIELTKEEYEKYKGAVKEFDDIYFKIIEKIDRVENERVKAEEKAKREKRKKDIYGRRYGMSSKELE